MPRFRDDWVVDKTLFEYAMGGSCACCGSKQLFNSDLKSLIDQCTDLETDAASAELNAAVKSPWPPDMRNEVWAGRVKLRLKLKRERKTYREFFEHSTVEDVEHFMLNKLGVGGLRRIFQLPRSLITETVKDQYGIPKHSAYGALLATVAEQVAQFEVTQYEADAQDGVEMEFEKCLSFDKRGGFVIQVDEENVEDVVKVFVNRMVSLGAQKLLSRRPKKGTTTNNKDEIDEATDDNEEEGGDVDAAADNEGFDDNPSDGPSFRSDRRMIRLLIARQWSDLIMDKWNKAKDASDDGQEER